MNWIKRPTEISPAILDGVEVSEITAALRTADLDVSSAGRLKQNSGRCFYGPIPAGKGFVLDREQAKRFLARSDASYKDVVRPYLVGDDNEVDEGAYKDLAKLHRQLDEAVAAAYGWPKSAAHDPNESNRRLLDLNQQIAAGKIDYRPFKASGS